MSQNNKNIDELSNVETTGHEWDGIKELNNPSPRWWLWVFFLTCIWAIGYWVVYPAWPTLSGQGERGGTKGRQEWTQYKELRQQQEAILTIKAQYLAKFQNSSFKEIMNDESLYKFAIAGGRSIFKENCATCHGTGGSGSHGYPNLNDDDWIWGGSFEDIYSTIKYGVRSNHLDTKTLAMPEFSDILSKDQVSDIAEYVVNLTKGKNLPKKGIVLYKENCAYCHGDKGTGTREIGAPNLVDSIWLYGDGSKDQIISQIKHPKHGVMPYWKERLSEDAIRQLTIFVHSLGGGK